jgi:uncharacterized SAM-binding protein YcdF (DUF218 family)
MWRYDLWNIIGAATWPLWLLLLGWLAVSLRHPRLGGGLKWVGIGLFCAIASTPLSCWLIQSLEACYPPQTIASLKVDTIVMLAGAEQLPASMHTGRPEYSEAGERIMAAAAVQKQFPQARLLLVGGVKLPGGREDISYARETLIALGVPASSIELLSGTRTTFENAQAVAGRLNARAHLLLITSAFHMPRAMLCFERFGLKPVAYPVDSRLPGKRTFVQRFSPNLIGNFKRFDDAMHEWVGLVAYKWLGHSRRYLP